METLTAVDVLINGVLDGALVGLVDRLGGDAVAKQGLRVHGALECVALPPEDVVAMRAVPLKKTNQPGYMEIAILQGGFGRNYDLPCCPHSSIRTVASHQQASRPCC